MDRFPFPDDLIRAQREWHAICRALAVPRPRHATELRRRLLMLSVRIHWHPFWSTPAGWTPAARVALRQQACGHRSEGAPDPAARRPWAG
ncbi:MULTISPECIES: hypothetical protein [Streptomyces]|uniref:hypothetical protein n=1 Tax=Streptomyces TaxID=1883 RepID=UPI000241AD9F|nr:MULTISPECIES: hypothetical protein [Streptomyces]EHM25682.1 hypothetical protein SPW_5900 [Streptomyces sp. W007]WTD23121.1 hypothetical protein OH737_00580 [Streptomyces anulatus]